MAVTGVVAGCRNRRPRAADPAGLHLTGVATATVWDPSLAEAMSHAGRSVMEERLIDVLPADLRTRTHPTTS